MRSTLNSHWFSNSKSFFWMKHSNVIYQNPLIRLERCRALQNKMVTDGWVKMQCGLIFKNPLNKWVLTRVRSWHGLIFVRALMDGWIRLWPYFLLVLTEGQKSPKYLFLFINFLKMCPKYVHYHQSLSPKSLLSLEWDSISNMSNFN